MNDKSVLDKYFARSPLDVTGGEVAEAEPVDDLVSFGYLRGTRERAVMLELRKRDGNIHAVGYSWLERAELDLSTGIILHVAGEKIRIKGRDLNSEVRPNVRLFQGIIRHRVAWIQEADHAAVMESRGKGLLVESITW